MGFQDGRARPAVLGKVLYGLSRALFPAKCLGCGRLFHSDAGTPPGTGIEASDHGRIMAGYFCPRCRSRWTAVASPFCLRCGMVFKSRAGRDHYCGRCLDHPGSFTRARAAGIYENTLRIAIQAFKFKGKVCLAGPLGRLLFKIYRQYWQTGDIDVVVPVPLHRRRFRQRGFNQAYLLVKAWDLPGETVVVRDLLVRNRETASQTGLDRRQRRINIKNAFAVSHPGASDGQRVLLVDDVLTTGATVEACAKVLLIDGAVQVDVLTLARAL